MVNMWHNFTRRAAHSFTSLACDAPLKNGHFLRTHIFSLGDSSEEFGGDLSDSDRVRCCYCDVEPFS